VRNPRAAGAGGAKAAKPARAAKSSRYRTPRGIERWDVGGYCCCGSAADIDQRMGVASSSDGQLYSLVLSSCSIRHGRRARGGMARVNGGVSSDVAAACELSNWDTFSCRRDCFPWAGTGNEVSLICSTYPHFRFVSTSPWRWPIGWPQPCYSTTFRQGGGLNPAIPQQHSTSAVKDLHERKREEGRGSTKGSRKYRGIGVRRNAS
jgi:hypothetical protein